MGIRTWSWNRYWCNNHYSITYYNCSTHYWRYIILADSHGILTGTASDADINAIIDVALCSSSPILSMGVSNVMGRALTSISKDKQIVQTTSGAIEQYELSKYIKIMSENRIDTTRDQIISKEAKESINKYSEWEVTV